jgi:prevent-host-death family protein
MIVTDEELNANLWHYLELVANEDILITSNGKVNAKLVSLRDDKAPTLHSLRGILKNIGGVTINSVHEDRLAKYKKSID